MQYIYFNSQLPETKNEAIHSFYDDEDLSIGIGRRIEDLELLSLYITACFFSSWEPGEEKVSSFS
jgi:hypothetical protein